MAFPKIGLYIRQTPSLLVELYKVAKERLLLTLQVMQAAHNSGQELSVRQAEEQAKHNLKHQ